MKLLLSMQALSVLGVFLVQLCAAVDWEMTDSGLYYKEITAPSAGAPMPEADDIVTVEYSGFLTDGTEFDSTRSRGAVEFQVDALIPGVTEALQLMGVGGEYEIYVPADLAYGDEGIPGVIPGEEALMFTYKLVSIRDAEDDAESTNAKGGKKGKNGKKKGTDTTPTTTEGKATGGTNLITEAQTQTQTQAQTQETETDTEAASDEDWVAQPSGLYIRTLEAGTAGTRPSLTDTVRIHYDGYMVDGTPFDSSYSRGEPSEFEVSKLIDGASEALTLMEVGGKYEIYLPAELAYGQEGVPGVIPPNTPLMFTYELLDIVGSKASASPSSSSSSSSSQSTTTSSSSSSDADTEWTQTDSGLYIRTIQEGSGDVPAPTDTVLVHYRGYFTDGKEFDSSYTKGQPASFQVNALIPGVVEALQLMQKGGTYEVYVPSDLGYGVAGIPNVIPPNAPFMFTYELMDITRDPSAVTESTEDPGEWVTTEGGAYVRATKKSDGAFPSKEDTVTVHYKGLHLDGVEFDSSYSKGAPASFEVGRLIQGVTEALMIMQVGGEYEVYVPSALAYGEAGIPGIIAPNEDLFFEYFLLSIDTPSATLAPPATATTPTGITTAPAIVSAGGNGSTMEVGEWMETDDGIWLRATKAGTGPSPTMQDSVKVHYRGYFLDGAEFDSSYTKNAPVTFEVSKLVPGVSIALQKFQKGGAYEVYIPAELAYGKDGIPGVIPPNSDLFFEYELIDVMTAAPAPQNLGIGGSNPFNPNMNTNTNNMNTNMNNMNTNMNTNTNFNNNNNNNNNNMNSMGFDSFNNMNTNTNPYANNMNNNMNNNNMDYNNNNNNMNMGFDNYNNMNTNPYSNNINMNYNNMNTNMNNNNMNLGFDNYNNMNTNMNGGYTGMVDSGRGAVNGRGTVDPNVNTVGGRGTATAVSTGRGTTAVTPNTTGRGTGAVAPTTGGRGTMAPATGGRGTVAPAINGRGTVASTANTGRGSGYTSATTGMSTGRGVDTARG